MPIADGLQGFWLITLKDQSKQGDLPASMIGFDENGPSEEEARASALRLLRHLRPGLELADLSAGKMTPREGQRPFGAAPKE